MLNRKLDKEGMVCRGQAEWTNAWAYRPVCCATRKQSQLECDGVCDRCGNRSARAIPTSRSEL